MKFGQLLMERRRQAGLTQTDVAQRLVLPYRTDDRGLSTSFYCGVEHDTRTLGFEYWPRLIHTIPGLTLEALSDAALETGPVRFDIRDLRLSPEERGPLIDILVRMVWDTAARRERRGL